MFVNKCKGLFTHPTQISEDYLWANDITDQIKRCS